MIKNDIPIIGWTGTHSTGKYLGEIVNILNEVAEKVQFRFLYISNKPSEFDIPNMEFVRWSKSTEIYDLNKVDIGIMPLENDEWAKGKCGFKALQYMALEIPALASPVGVNEEIVDHGINGFHCRSSIDWKERIIELIENPALRVKMGKEGRKKVLDKYSVISNAENFLNMLKS